MSADVAQSIAASRVLVTGAAGHIGTTLLARVARPEAAVEAPHLDRVVATDVREVPASARRAGVDYRVTDVRSGALGALLAEQSIDTVVHLAAIVTPGRRSSRTHQHAIDVEGTHNLLEACVSARVRRLIVASSGAAYGYHADSPPLIDEDTPLRGNPEFAYSDHKRQVEEMLVAYRASHPALAQLVFRIGTVLGPAMRNQITALFERPILLGLRGATSPFVFVWDEDVADAIAHGLATGRNGIYNLAGDGALTLDEIAAMLGKPCLRLPAGLVRGALALLHPLGLAPYGPEQVSFLRYRPVLDNRRLKEEFGFIPRHGSMAAFERHARARGLLHG